MPEIYKEYGLQHQSQAKFTAKYGGKVFYIFSTKIDGQKRIVNLQVVDEIKTEIKRLEAMENHGEIINE